MPFSRFAPAIGLLALGAFFVFCFEAIGEVYFKSYLLDLGMQTMPSPHHMVFMAAAGIFGGLAAAVFVGAFLQLAGQGDWVDRALERWRDSRDVTWIVLLTLLALAMPVLVRAFLLGDTVLTDDESAYQFTSELLASGRLTVDSPPLKLFYDRTFMINDGQMYSLYFVGWPALMAPGVWLGVPGYMNAVYFALTVPAIFFVARRLVGASWAKLATLLFVFSPILLLGASTQLSNTSVVFALVWSLWFFMRSQDDDAPLWAHAGCSLAFALAFFVRPTAAIGTGGPIVALWCIRHLRPGRLRAPVVAAFVVPALLTGALFLYVNKAQTGSATMTGYAREHQYVGENDLRFSNWTVSAWKKASSGTAHFADDLGPTALAAAAGAAGFRLIWTVLGFPLAFVFLLFARRRPWIRLLWLMVIAHFLLHATANVPGLDIFGPHRFVAPAVPLILLIVIGARRVSAWLASLDLAPALRLIPPVVLLIGLTLNLRMYLPVRAGGMARMATSVSRPEAKLAELGIENAVIFSPRPFAPACDIEPTRHWVYWRPNNDPDLENPILWVNHVTIEDNRRLMKFFPQRRGYVMRWVGDCKLVFMPLEELGPDDVPRGFIGGSDKGLPPELTGEEIELEQRRSK